MTARAERAAGTPTAPRPARRALAAVALLLGLLAIHGLALPPGAAASAPATAAAHAGREAAATGAAAMARTAPDPPPPGRGGHHDATAHCAAVLTAATFLMLPLVLLRQHRYGIPEPDAASRAMARSRRRPDRRGNHLLTDLCISRT